MIYVSLDVGSDGPGTGTISSVYPRAPCVAPSGWSRFSPAGCGDNGCRPSFLLGSLHSWEPGGSRCTSPPRRAALPTSNDLRVEFPVSFRLIPDTRLGDIWSEHVRSDGFWCRWDGYSHVVLTEDERDRLLLLYRDRVAGYSTDSDEFGDRWRSWCRVVLAHGGALVVPPLTPEPDLDVLLAAAELHGPMVETPQLGGDCHANVAKLWIDGDIAAIGTGYALGHDLWRQHSWGVDADGTVVETKSPAESYLGVTLAPGRASVGFALNGYDGDVGARLKAGGGRTADIIAVLRASRQRRASS